MTQLGLSPGAIVGGVLVLLAITAMLAATFVVVWRSRPSAAAAAARTKRGRKSIDIERVSAAPPHRDKSKGESVRDKGDISIDSTTSSDADPSSPVTPVCPIAVPVSVALAGRSHSVASTVNLIISPSVPHLVKLGANGALEVRVTPPSPVLMPTDGSLRIGGISGSPCENDSVWWVI